MHMIKVESPVEMAISPQKVVFLIEKAREFDAKDAPTKRDPASNPSDDRMVEVLEDHPDDPVLLEMTGLINSLNEDEKIDLVALMWMGRDDYDVEQWDRVRGEAAQDASHRTAHYVVSTPLL